MGKRGTAGRAAGRRAPDLFGRQGMPVELAARAAGPRRADARRAPQGAADGVLRAPFAPAARPNLDEALTGAPVRRRAPTAQAASTGAPPYSTTPAGAAPCGAPRAGRAARHPRPARSAGTNTHAKRPRDASAGRPPGRVHPRPGRVTQGGGTFDSRDASGPPRRFESMSASWSSTQSPGSRAVTTRLSPCARHERSSSDMLKAR
jgi:hypothetical protein